MPRDLFGEVELSFVRCAVGETALGCRVHGGDDFRVGVAENQRSPRTHEVEEPIAVDVREVRALSFGDEDRRTTHRAECSDG